MPASAPSSGRDPGRVIAIANQKGGVGKTTTCVNLACALADNHKRVLVVDIDPQGNATMGCGVDKHDLEFSSYDLLLGDEPLAQLITHPDELPFDLIGSNRDVTAAEVELLDADDGARRLTRALDGARSRYDHILIDCPPSLNMLTINALTAADGVMIPMQCEYYALEGLSALMQTIESIQDSVNPGLQVEGLIRTMFDVRNNLSTEVSNQLLEHFGDQVYRTVIPRNVRVAEAPSFGLPVIRYDRTSRGAEAYLGLAGEMLRRERRSVAHVAAN